MSYQLCAATWLAMCSTCSLWPGGVCHLWCLQSCVWAHFLLYRLNTCHASIPPLLPHVLFAAARMCTFAETRCGGFEASAASGYLHAWLANVGTLPASYTIIVTDCT